jgi:large subunit ribosomal protein L21e
MRHSKGFLTKRTRSLTKKRTLTVCDRVRTFNVDDRVLINVKPYREGMPSPRYNGKSGRIVERRGNAYVVQIKDGRMLKTLVASPLHLRVLK